MTAADGLAGCILVVEDDQVLRALIEELLQEFGAEVAACATTEEVLPCIERARPDLLIVDLTIERAGDGWELIEHLRADPLTQAMPILICTGMPEDRLDDKRRRWLVHQGIPMINKPFDLDEFYTVVHELLQSTRHTPGAVAE